MPIPTFLPSPARGFAFRAVAFAAAALCTAGLAAPSAFAQATPAAPPAAPAAKQPITSADQLPRRTVTLAKLPSELLEGPLADVLALATALERQTLSDLATYDIRDAATLRGLHGYLLAVAQLRGDWKAAAVQSARLRELQDKPAQRLTTGVLADAIGEVKAAGGSAEAQRTALAKLVEQRYGALPWAEVQDTVKALRGSLEVANPQLVIGTFRQQVDLVAKNGNMVVPEGLAAAIVGTRAQLDVVVPLKDAIVAGLTPVIERQQAAAAPKVDRWTPRLVNLPADAKAQPVVVGVWDSGVDMALFPGVGGVAGGPKKGFAWDADSRVVPDLLRPLGEAAPRWPQLKLLTQGALDLQAGLDTEASRGLRRTMAGLKAEQAIPFQEDLAIASLYTHGTHVAGIAVAGNPVARVFPVSMHFSHKAVPFKPDMERSQRQAARFAEAVKAMQAAGVRVVNMSWRYGPGAYEGALAFHGVGKDAEERKRIARELFAVERDALRAAFASAPEILFVAGSGNEDNNADFVEYIPAGLELPNLITAGAVDQAGEETGFSSFGRTVVVHANGFQVESVIPGGEKMRFSGTSMAAPQVTNLAAKLFALDPKLTPVQVKAMILAGAERRGRVNLIDPRATIAKVAPQLVAAK
jgi:subtilisin family serine protease